MQHVLSVFASQLRLLLCFHSMVPHCYCITVLLLFVVIVANAWSVEAVASPRGELNRRHASRGQRAGDCCPAESGQPICWGDGLDDDSIGCLVDVRAIGRRASWVPPLCAGTSSCNLATWPKRELRHWLIDSEIDGRPVDLVISLFWMNWCHYY